MLLIVDCWELKPSSVLSASSIPPSKSLSSSPVLSLSMQLNAKLSENRNITMMISKGHGDLKTLLTHERHWNKKVIDETLFLKNVGKNFCSSDLISSSFQPLDSSSGRVRATAFTIIHQERERHVMYKQNPSGGCRHTPEKAFQRKSLLGIFVSTTNCDYWDGHEIKM